MRSGTVNKDMVGYIHALPDCLEAKLTAGAEVLCNIGSADRSSESLLETHDKLVSSATSLESSTILEYLNYSLSRPTSGLPEQG
jgi:hypothetical protein